MSKKHREAYEEEKDRMQSEGAVEHPEEVSKEESEADAAGETQETIDSEASSEDQTDASSEDQADASSEDHGESAELAALKDKYLRTLAEYENFRKRSEKEKTQMYELGGKSIIEHLLPIVDNFERALEHISEEQKEDPFVKGIEGIYKQFQKMFADCDIRPIEAVGQKFDPALHNAVMTEEDGDAEEDTVTADLQKGYTYRGNVVRHSMVKVKK